MGIFGALESLIPAQLKASGKFTIPGITMGKLRKKPATKAGKRMAFGKEVFVKAKPAKTLVKCYTVKALRTPSEVRASLFCGGHDGALALGCGALPQPVRALGGPVRLCNASPELYFEDQLLLCTPIDPEFKS